MTSAVGRAIALFLVFVTFAGCANSKETSATQARSNLLVDPDGARELGYVPQWATDLPFARRGSVAHAKVLGDVVVVVERPSQIVTCLSMRDGKVLWRHGAQDVGAEVFAPARAGDSILINTGTRLWQIRARDGEVQKITNLELVVSTGALVFGDFAIFGGIDGTVFAHILDAGITRWKYRLSNQVLAQLVLVGDNILATDTNGVYAMITAESGSFLWRGRTFASIVAEPATDSANIYVPSRDGVLYALERTKGRDQWQYRTETPLVLPSKVFDTSVILPVPNQGIVALDAPTGKVAWEMEGVKALPVAQQGNDVIFAASDKLMRVGLATGRVRAEAATKPLAAIRAGEGDSLVVVSPDGRVLRLNPLK